ncbi:MAG: hypothetical protein N4A74_14225 [Carboxylicivirga sp.]|jgi:hypothetical protein|nr:hypothetical protein [Carboxylicivirga sp.]
MKKLRLVICLFFFGFTLFSQAPKDIRSDLVKYLYTEFTKALKTRYQGNASGYSDEFLYKKFVMDFYCQFGHKSYDVSDLFPNPVDTVAIRALNKRLFIRDQNHFYYFFPERVVVKQRIAPDDLGKIYDLLKPVLPDGASLSVSAIGRQSKDAKSLSYAHSSVVELDNQPLDFLDEQLEDLSRIALVADRLQLTWSQVDYPKLVHAIIYSGAIGDLSKPNERQLLSVIFWKLLCSKANDVEGFYALPDNAKDVLDNYLKSLN